MRVMYVNDALAIYGGLERILVEKMNLLAEWYGYELHIVTLNQGNHPLPYHLSPRVNLCDLNIQLHRQYQYHGLKRIFKKRALDGLFRKQLHQKIQEVTPDIIVCPRADLMGVIMKVKGSIPLVFESHASRFGYRFIASPFLSRQKIAFYNRKVKAAQVVVALTDGDAADWKEINPHVRVIPNVVHLNKSGLYSDGMAKSVIFVGRFSEQKDISSLMRIWEAVHRKHQDWHLQIYGSYGELQGQLIPEILQMDANISLHTPTKDILERYCESSILVLTSRFEPFGLVLPEAMSCGLPVVAFDCPYGPSDIISDGKDGFLIKDRNVSDFADKLCLLIENPELRREMGKAAIISSHRYSAERIMPLWKDLFEHLIQKRP